MASYNPGSFLALMSHSAPSARRLPQPGALGRKLMVRKSTGSHPLQEFPSNNLRERDPLGP